jgi:hypothetical protein
MSHITLFLFWEKNHVVDISFGNDYHKCGVIDKAVHRTTVYNLYTPSLPPCKGIFLTNIYQIINT